jgi:hypothetical protein
VALVSGVVGLLTSLVVVGGLFGIAALVFGVRGRSLARRGEATNPGVATAGLITGALALLTAIAVVGGTWAFVERYGDDYQKYQDCLRDARTSQDREACSERFGEDVRRRADLDGATPAPSTPASPSSNPSSNPAGLDDGPAAPAGR